MGPEIRGANPYANYLLAQRKDLPIIFTPVQLYNAQNQCLYDVAQEQLRQIEELQNNLNNAQVGIEQLKSNIQTIEDSLETYRERLQILKENPSAPTQYENTTVEQFTLGLSSEEMKTPECLRTKTISNFETLINTIASKLAELQKNATISKTRTASQWLCPIL